ncbi:hypothetical protein SLA2020_453190 [Shorea laevis]
MSLRGVVANLEDTTLIPAPSLLERNIRRGHDYVSPRLHLRREGPERRRCDSNSVWVWSGSRSLYERRGRPCVLGEEDRRRWSGPFVASPFWFRSWRG